MRIISKSTIKTFYTTHAGARAPLIEWYENVQLAHWENLAQVRALFPHTDAVRVASGRTVTIFNVAGNKYRLIAAIHFNTGLIYILRIMTHAEYSKDQWKEQL